MEQTLVDEHISEEWFELYVMGRLPEAQTADLEEHVLFCEECQDTLRHVDEFILAFRAAAPKAVRAPAKPGFWQRLRNWIGISRIGLLAPAAVACGAVIMVILAPMSLREPSIETVELASARGEAGITAVTAGNRLHMVLDTRGLAELPVYTVELVDSRGNPEWTGKVKPSARGLSVTTSEAVPAGQHWLRIKSGSGEPLREFGVLARPPQ